MSNVNSSGFKYRSDSLGIDSSDFLVAFDFTKNPSLNNGFVEPCLWSSGCYSGKVNGSMSSFFQTSGSAYFSSFNSVDILGGIPNDNFSFLFCYEKKSTGSCVLLTSLTGSSYSSSSGLTLGITSNNNLYLEYWNSVDGRMSFTYNENIASKNIVYLNKSSQNFNLGVFDAENSKLKFSTFQIKDSNYVHSDKFRIGGNNNFYSSSEIGFNGYIDDFYCFKKTYPQDYYPSLCSGFYSEFVPSSLSGSSYVCDNVSVLTGSGVIIGTGITGYSSSVTYSTGYVPTGYYNSGYSYVAGTGITGYAQRYVGTLEDACGFFNPVYVMDALTGLIYAYAYTGVYSGLEKVVTPTYVSVPLTGFLTGSVFVPVNIQECKNKDIYYPSRVEVDNDFLYSLGFDSIYKLGNCASIGTGEVYVYPSGAGTSSINNEPKYNASTFEYFVDNNFSGIARNLLFRNGRVLLESGYSFYMDGNIQKYNLTGDYFLSGINIMSNLKNKVSDKMLYDNSSGIDLSAKFVSTNVLPNSNLSNYFSAPYDNISIFLNGIKLLNGVEYNSSVIKVAIPASSVLIKVSDDYVSSSKIRQTGSFNNGFIDIFTAHGKRFFSKNSQFYFSGLRLSPYFEYMPVSNFSLISGCQIPSSTNLFYSTSDNEMFWI